MKRGKKMLESIQVRGFKSIRSLDISLGPLNVLIGANGAGKSNFISLFKFLNDLIRQNLQIAVPREGGVDTFLFRSRKVTEEINIRLSFGQNRYECTLIPTVENNFLFKREICFFQGPGHDQPYQTSLGKGHGESKLRSLAGEKKRGVASFALNAMNGWKVYHFHDTTEDAKVKGICPIDDSRELYPDARNLPAFLRRLSIETPKNYGRIVDTIRLVAPFFGDFVLEPIPANSSFIELAWRERGVDRNFRAHHLSDGTLRFMCLATLLSQPDPPSTIVIDEPELGLHPYAIAILAALIKRASTRTQVIVSTQSVQLVNQFDPEDLLIVEREQGGTVVKRPDSQQLESWLEEYSLGELWEKNVLGGRPSWRVE